jgi:PhzF family phenazine biosynthesis protein
VKQTYWVVDAFTSRRFGGNPAGVCPLDRWLEDETLQSIAAENHLAETAFLVPRGDEFDLRWFTPTVEMDLCGHATLASAWALFHLRGNPREALTFHTKSGALTVTRDGKRLVLDFPSRPATPCAPPPELVPALGVTPLEVLRANDLLCVLESEAAVRAVSPDIRALARIDTRGVIVTAPGTDADFVSRFFAPAVGVDEDPVTGSAHCTLVPYWAARLGKNHMFARQVSRRGGELWCEARGERVALAGRAVLYLEGQIEI